MPVAESRTGTCLTATMIFIDGFTRAAGAAGKSRDCGMGKQEAARHASNPLAF
jgi:hypothetical protein